MRSLFAIFALAWALFGCQTLAPTPASFEVNETTVQVIGILGGGLEKEPLAQMQAAPEGSTVYVYLFSLGGDPRVADAFLNAMEGKTTVCFAGAAGGPAFTILQACTYRLVGEKSLIGNSKFRFRGTTGDPEKDKEFVEAVNKMAERFAELESDRLDLSAADYDALLTEGFGWMTGADIMTNKGADAQVELGCTAEANSSTLKRTVYDGGPGGYQLVIEMTLCPVLRQLVSPEGAPAGEVGDAIGIPLTQLRKI